MTTRTQDLEIEETTKNVPIIIMLPITPNINAEGVIALNMVILVPMIVVQSVQHGERIVVDVVNQIILLWCVIQNQNMQTAFHY